MSPSRGNQIPTARPPMPATSTSSETSTELKADVASTTALSSLRLNLSYLLDPASASSSPARLRTRALLRSLHYMGVFVFWRIVRYAKYAVVGAVVAAAGATAFGGVVSGLGLLVAPPTVVGTVGLGIVYSLGRWGFRKMGVRGVVAGRAAEGERRGLEEVRRDGGWRGVQGPRAQPW